MTKTDLHILILEDDAMDAELNKAQLEHLDEYNCIVQVVSNRGAYLEALKSNCPDIILSDYKIYQYNGLEALYDLKARHIVVPFIFVTGAINEETAAATIKEGAWDYVVKDRLSRLPLAIRSALKLREEKINTAKAEAQNKKLSMAIEQGPAQIVICNKEGIVEYVNSKFTEVTGYKSDEVIDKNVWLFFPFDAADVILKEVWKNLQKGVSWRGEIQNTKKDGTLFWEYVSISPIKDQNETITHFVAVKEDITKRKLMEKELIEARDKAERSDKLKDIFLQNLSHEIRTPLNAVVGFADILHNDKNISRDNLDSYTDIIKNSSNQLLSIVSDILTIASIQTGHETVNYKTIEINKLFDELYATFLSKAKEKHLDLAIYKESPKMQLFAITDETKLFQILANLIKNAIKFTERGSVEIKYSVANGSIEFSVKDTGIGIPEAVHDLIFERFRQADHTINVNYGGTGLGLAIARAFSQMLGGNIRLESVLGKGSTFYVSIPFSSHKIDNQEGKPVNPTNQKITILVAEDEFYNYRLIEAILSSKDVTLLHAKNGSEAVDFCKNVPHIDVVLMDIKMPVMNGITALKEIKKLRKDLPVIAQTAYILECEKQSIIEMGFTDYIAKPIIKNELLRIVYQSIHRSTP